jgi:molybdopterin molybdotransferase
MPPFRKSMMDGYAVRAADTIGAPVTLDIVETIHAGTVPTAEVGPGQASAIMTGAPLPDGADAVVMVEKTAKEGDGRVVVGAAVPEGNHIVPPGEDVREGQLVFAAGTRIFPPEVASLAAVGCDPVPVYAAPRVCVYTTGDEVVSPAETPGPGRIRNSNSPMLAARVARDVGDVRDGGVVPDEVEAIRRAAAETFGEYDVVILTGGVSMGEKDLVAGALREEGLEVVFHKVSVKPGKPVLFGKAKGTLVFGLPGNPVSSAVTYELIVRPALMKLAGRRPLHRQRIEAELEGPAPRAIPREQYLPARLRLRGAGFVVRLVPWNGSADLFSFAAGNALLRVPRGGPAPETGDRVVTIVLKDALSSIVE